MRGEAMRVLHVITNLDTGGAETALLKVATGLKPRGFEQAVVSLQGTGTIGPLLQAAGIPVTALGLAKSAPNPWRLGPLRRAMPAFDVVQSWMYHADLVVGVLGAFTRRAEIVWNIRHSVLNETSPLRTRLVARACALLSRRIPRRIVCCSVASATSHRRMGYSAGRMRVIPNGFDAEVFRPDPEARAAVRREWNVSEQQAVVGLVGRFHPDKDLDTFLRAAGIVSRAEPGARFVLVGTGLTKENAELSDAIRRARVGNATFLLGRRSDVPRLMAGMDLLCSSSRTEGFSNVIGEAMATGLPCAVTDVGDSALLVADTGRVVPPREPERLASALLELVSMTPVARRALGAQARRRLLDDFSLARILDEYESLYREVAAGAVRGQ